MWATPDPIFSQAMCRVYNDYAWEVFGPHYDRMRPLAAIATGNIDSAIEEIERCARLGFKGLSLPCKPMWGPGTSEDANYNNPTTTASGPASTSRHDLPRLHGGPRGRSNGGAVINYDPLLAPTAEPLVHLCSSGILDCFPARFASIEAGIG
jgi:hypothetical protein